MRAVLRVLLFVFSLLVLTALWLVFDVPGAVRWWLHDKWRVIVELWENTAP